MNDFEKFISENPITAQKFWQDQETKNNIQYAEIVYEKLNLLAALINSLNEQKIPIKGDLIWSETILFKFLLHSSSFLNLFKKTKMYYRDKVIELFDEPTIIVMFRVLLENYLTFFYLYCDKISDEEKQFRMNVWRYCGIKQRSEFEVFYEEMINEQKIALIEAEKLKIKIKSSPSFLLFKNIQNEILKGRKARLYGWEKIIERSGFSNSLFKRTYSYQSAYAHTEFHSIFQMRQKTEFQILPDRLHMFLIIAHLIICKCIIDLKELFPSIKKVFEEMDSRIVKEVEFAYLIGVNQVLDKTK